MIMITSPWLNRGASVAPFGAPRKLWPLVCLLLTLSLGTARVTHAGFILAGNYTLLANTPSQVIELRASPSVVGEIAEGLNLHIVIDDGGSVAGGIDDNAPKITAVNVQPAGGLFAGVTQVPSTLITQKISTTSLPITLVAERPVVTNNALLALVTLDTTGLNSGNWTISLDGLPSILLPESDFGGVAATITNGTLSIAAVPEPGSLILFAIGATTLGVRRRIIANKTGRMV